MAGRLCISLCLRSLLDPVHHSAKFAAQAAKLFPKFSDKNSAIGYQTSKAAQIKCVHSHRIDNARSMIEAVNNHRQGRKVDVAQHAERGYRPGLTQIRSCSAIIEGR